MAGIPSRHGTNVHAWNGTPGEAGLAERQLASESRVLDLLAADRPLQDVLEALCIGVEELLPGALCSILLLDAAGRRLLLGGAPTLPLDYSLALDGVEIGENVGSCGRAAFLNEPVVVASIDTDPLWADFRELAVSHDLHACWSTPIRAADASVLGTFAIYYRTPHQPSVFEHGLVERARSLASLAILRKRAAEALAAQMQLAKVTLESITDGVITADAEGRITYLNPVAEQLTGWQLDDARGILCLDVFRLGDERHVQAVALALTSAAGAGVATRFKAEGLLVRRDGAAFNIETSIAPLRESPDPDKVLGVVIAFRNVTSERGIEARLQHRATHDPVTDLANRMLLVERLDRAIDECQRQSSEGALLLLDLDGFQTVNDKHGHVGGDALLRSVAARLGALAPEGATVSRPGRDQFMVLLPKLSGAAAAEDVAARVLEALAMPHVIGEETVSITTSVGVSLFPGPSLRQHGVIRHAEVALRQAKRDGGGVACLYEPGLTGRSPENEALQARLAEALVAEEFVLHYQPRARLSTGKVSGVEALLRWNSPERGMVMPAEFIVEIEESGLVVPIGEWVLRTAFEQARAWQEEGVPVLPVAVNVSPVQLTDPLFPDFIAVLLAEVGIEASAIELEITETAAVRDLDATVAVLTRLSKLGVRVAVDDFGTGHAGLGYLKRFPVNVLKIDQGFIRDLATDADDASITRAIIELGKSLRLSVIAEGVETADQLAFLRAHGCDEIQGRFLAGALPPARVAAFAATACLPPD